MYKNYTEMHSPKNIKSFSITNSSRLHMFREVIDDDTVNRTNMTLINKLCGQNAKVLNVTTDGTTQQ